MEVLPPAPLRVHGRPRSGSTRHPLARRTVVLLCHAQVHTGASDEIDQKANRYSREVEMPLEPPVVEL
jgi:hypothetical protein